MKQIFKNLRDRMANFRKLVPVTTVEKYQGKEYIIPKQSIPTLVPGLSLFHMGFEIAPKYDAVYANKIIQVAEWYWGMVRGNILGNAPFMYQDVETRAKFINTMHHLVEFIRGAWEDKSYYLGDEEKIRIFDVINEGLDLFSPGYHTPVRKIQITTMLLDQIGVKQLAFVNRPAWTHARDTFHAVREGTVEGMFGKTIYPFQVKTIRESNHDH